MKKTIKTILCVVLVAAFVLALAGCEKINYITDGTIQAIKEVQDGTYKDTGEEEDTGASTIDPFTSGTYGGVEFADEAAVVDYYVQCYNNTKSQTANYKDADGNAVTYYALLGEESLSIEKVLIEGSENSVINNLVPTIVDGLFAPSTYGLPPCNNRDPQLDNSNQDPANPGEFDFRTSYFTADDCQACILLQQGCARPSRQNRRREIRRLQSAAQGKDCRPRHIMRLADRQPRTAPFRPAGKGKYRRP